MGVKSLPRTVTQQRRGCDLNPGPTSPESSTLTTRLPSMHPIQILYLQKYGYFPVELCPKLRTLDVLRMP